MAASKYMTEADYEGIWDTAFETARFALVGVRIAEFINFKINRDATSQITNTAYTPILEHFSEEVCILLNAAAKIEKTVQPWTFINANTMRFLKAQYELYREEFDEIRESLTKQYHYTESQDLNLPGTISGLIKRTTS